MESIQKKPRIAPHPPLHGSTEIKHGNDISRRGSSTKTPIMREYTPNFVCARVSSYIISVFHQSRPEISLRNRWWFRRDTTLEQDSPYYDDFLVLWWRWTLYVEDENEVCQKRMWVFCVSGWGVLCLLFIKCFFLNYLWRNKKVLYLKSKINQWI